MKEFFFLNSNFPGYFGPVMPPAGMDGNYEVEATSILIKSRNKISFVLDYPIGHIQVCFVLFVFVRPCVIARFFGLYICSF